MRPRASRPGLLEILTLARLSAPAGAQAVGSRFLVNLNASKAYSVRSGLREQIRC